jgi:phosphate:Na+ symporter
MTSRSQNLIAPQTSRRFPNQCQTASDHSRIILILLALCGFLLLSGTAYGAEPGESGIVWSEMLFQLFGGLALFLFGMEQMASALKMVAGNRMKSILARLTNNRFMGMFTGAFVTAIIQSSSVTTVILVGFVSTGIMSLSQAIGVILGANIGTTVTAQIVAFKVTKYALVLVSSGFALQFLSKRNTLKHYGGLIMGLGLIFYGMALMSGGMKPLRSYQPFIDLMGSVETPIIGIAVAAAFTALVQSSSATLGVVIALALQGLITLEAGIALALGSNVGTCVTAGLAAIGKTREAVRVAVAHIGFNVIGVLILVWFIGPFADLVRSISPTDTGLTGQERLAAETPRQIANAHTLFNIAVALIFVPFLTPFTRLCEWLVKDRPLHVVEVLKPKYLDKELLDTPTFALERARFEVGRMSEMVEDMLASILPTAFTGSSEELAVISDKDADIDALYAHIVEYLGKISVQELTDEQTKELTALFELVQQLEEIGDIVESRMVPLGLRRIEENIVVSDETAAKISDVHQQVVATFDLTTTAIQKLDKIAAKEARSRKQSVLKLAKEAARHEVGRLMVNAPNRLATYSFEIEILDQLQAIFRRAQRIAKTTLSFE